MVLGRVQRPQNRRPLLYDQLSGGEAVRTRAGERGVVSVNHFRKAPDESFPVAPVGALGEAADRVQYLRLVRVRIIHRSSFSLHSMGLPSRKNPPDGPPSARVAAHTTPAAPSSTG